MDTIILIFTIITCVIAFIMIFAYIATRNTIITIVSTFEVQNASSYETRLKVFNRAINYLFNLNSKTIGEKEKRIELGEVFDDLLMCTTRQDTLAVFEKIVSEYFEKGTINEKAFLKFKGCVRKEFGAPDYRSKVISQYALPKNQFTPVDPLKPAGTTGTENEKSANFGSGAPKVDKPQARPVQSTAKTEDKNAILSKVMTGVTIIPGKQTVIDDIKSPIENGGFRTDIEDKE